MWGRCVAEKKIPNCVRDDSRGSGEMFPATVPALKASHDPSAPRLALMERAREKASRCVRDDSGGWRNGRLWRTSRQEPGQVPLCPDEKQIPRCGRDDSRGSGDMVPATWAAVEASPGASA